MLAGTDRSKATAIGRFLAARVDRSVRIDTTAGTRVATLRCREARANQKRYHFEITEPSKSSEAAGQPDVDAPAAPAAPPPRGTRRPRVGERRRRDRHGGGDCGVDLVFGGLTVVNVVNLGGPRFRRC